jgi:hypothetical protein
MAADAFAHDARLVTKVRERKFLSSRDKRKKYRMSSPKKKKNIYRSSLFSLPFGLDQKILVCV